MLPAHFKLVKWVLLVLLAAAGWGGWVLLIWLSMFLWGLGPGLGLTLHSFPASSPVPLFVVGPPESFYAKPMPSVHQLCCSWSAPIRGNSYTTFSLFALLGARHSWSLFRVFELPHCVKSFWGLLTFWVLLLFSEGAPPIFGQGHPGQSSSWVVEEPCIDPTLLKGRTVSYSSVLSLPPACCLEFQLRPRDRKRWGSISPESDVGALRNNHLFADLLQWRHPACGQMAVL